MVVHIMMILCFESDPKLVLGEIEGLLDKIELLPHYSIDSVRDLMVAYFYISMRVTVLIKSLDLTIDN